MQLKFLCPGLNYVCQNAYVLKCVGAKIYIKQRIKELLLIVEALTELQKWSKTHVFLFPMSISSTVFPLEICLNFKFWPLISKSLFKLKHVWLLVISRIIGTYILQIINSTMWAPSWWGIGVLRYSHINYNKKLYIFFQIRF